MSALLLFAGTAPQPLAAQTAPSPSSVRVEANGTIHADGITVPLSQYVSPQLQVLQARRLNGVTPLASAEPDVAALRAGYDRVARDVTKGWQHIWPVTITPLVLNGVQTDDVRPAAGLARCNRARVLINLHGGGFFLGARSGGWSEAAPVSGRGRIRVITIDYRLGPENRFPAASQDVEKVYRALLRHYKPGNIGIFGCSAGGALVAQSLAWFQAQGLPRPAAAGIFCSGAMPGFWSGGDMAGAAPMLNGQPQMPAESAAHSADMYLGHEAMENPLISPALFPRVLARFPPTLILTGTRDVAMSNALVTHARLLAVGNDSRIEVQEGLGHGEFNTAVGTPEARQAMDMIWHFFDRHLRPHQ